jgi:hypothetical protein
MKKIVTALKCTKVFGELRFVLAACAAVDKCRSAAALSDAFVAAAAANAVVVSVGAGAVIMKVETVCIASLRLCFVTCLQAGQANLSADTHYSPVDMNGLVAALRCSHSPPSRAADAAAAESSDDAAKAAAAGDKKVVGQSKGDALRQALHDMKKEWGLGVRGLSSRISRLKCQ